MNEIVVIGHRNPDTDSVCSAYCYAKLKQTIDKNNKYIAARCGNLNKQTRGIFDRLDIEPPVLIGNVLPTVSDVMTHNVFSVGENTALFPILRESENRRIKMLPVVNDSGEFLGVIRMNEITRFLLKGTGSDKPEYMIRPENFLDVLNGEFIKTGELVEIHAKVLVGAMSLENYQDRLEIEDAKRSILIVGKREGLIQQAIEKQIPIIIITGVEATDELLSIFDDYSGWVFLSNHDSAETMRRIAMCTPAKSIMNSLVTGLLPETDLLEAKKMLLSEESRGLPVLDENKNLVGVITMSDLVRVEPKRLILMDHNEFSQAVEGIETAEIIEIVDHHRLGSVKTKNPISFFAKPVGSTCTLVYQLFQFHGEKIEQSIALLLLSGILTDTVILKSPTTTDEDITALNALARIADVDPEQYGLEIFSASNSLKTRTPADVVNSDFKEFEEYGFRFGVGQVEVTSMNELAEKEQSLLEELLHVKTKKELTWAMLLVTDIIKEESVLLTTGHTATENRFLYSKKMDCHFLLPRVLSRKKQLLPEILRILEEIENLD